VEVGDAIEIKELPFVMGVMGDFSGQPTEPQARLKDRKFVEVNPDNFDSVLANMKPHLAYSVENKLSEDPNAGNLKVNLDFKSMDDFSPESVARQVGPLRELLELRDRLRDLRGNMQGNDKLEELLREAVTDKDKLAKLRTEMGVKEGSNE
jgi:type VI secretion system protein ImpB